MKRTRTSEIAKDLDVAGQRARYDAAARRLVAQKSILAYILKSTMEEFQNTSVKHIAERYIEGMPQVAQMAVQQDLPAEKDSLSGSNRLSTFTTEDVSIVEGAVRYDIHFMVCLPGQGERVEAIINIEVQNNDTPGYPIVKRGIYYGSRMISAQRGTGFKNQEYDKIKKVVSIWICEDTAKQRADSMNEYSFTEQCRRGTYQEQQKNYDLIRVVILRLGKEGERSQDDAIRLLSYIFSEKKTPEEKKTILSKEFQIAMTETIKEEVEEMCNLSAGIMERSIRRGLEQGLKQGLEQGLKQGLEQGLKQGLEQGLEKGLEQGREQGREEGAMLILNQLVKNKKCSIEEAAKLMGKEVSEFEKQYKAYYEEKQE